MEHHVDRGTRRVRRQVVAAICGVAILSAGVVFVATHHRGNEASPPKGAGTVTEFTAGIHEASTGAQPDSIVTGTDGAMWFTESNGDGTGYLGRSTSAGVVTRYRTGLDTLPQGITVGPDGALWFTETRHDAMGSIVRMAPAGTMTAFDVPGHGKWSAPNSIAVGPDGELWFTDPGTGAIGSVTTSGHVTEYALPHGAVPQQIAKGPDGRLWFTDAGTGAIGSISTLGAIKEYPLPHGASPAGITAGPNGELWFTDSGTTSLGSISTSGAIKEYPLPHGAWPAGITASRTGELWFADAGTNAIGVATTTGHVREFAVPTPGVSPNGVVQAPNGSIWFTELYGGIGEVDAKGRVTEYRVPALALAEGPTAGPDGNVWFAETNANRIGRITPEGSIEEFPVPTPSSGVLSLTAGGDGNVWFTEALASKIGRITPSGKITEFTVPSHGYMPGITRGPDGNIWFTQSSPNEIGRITPSGVVTEFAVKDHRADGGYFQDIATGSDGDLWFTEFDTNFLWRLDPTTGGVSAFSLGSEPTPNDTGTDAITNGPDGNLWVTGYGEHVVWRVTTTGDFVTFPVHFNHPDSIDAGPPGNIWITGNIAGGGNGASSIGRLTLSGVETDFSKGILPGGTDGGITAGPDGNQWFAGGNGVDAIGKFFDPAPPVDLHVALTSQTPSVTAGGAITYNLEITNNADTTAPAVAVVDHLPVGAVNPIVMPANDACSVKPQTKRGATTERRTISCKLGALAAHSSTTLTLVVDAYPRASGAFTNSVSVRAGSGVQHGSPLTASITSSIACGSGGCPPPPPPPEVCASDSCSVP